MAQLTEIRWHARAGQGAVTAATLVAEAALLQGKYIQAMPEYGPERTGAPLKAYTRVCDEPIEVHNNITNPQIVVILDETLIKLVDTTEGLTDDGVVVLNSQRTPAEARAELGVGDGVKVAVVDATGIALDTIGRDIPNTPIVAALSAVTGVIPVDVIKAQVVDNFKEKFSRKIIEANIKSIDRAFEEVQVG